MSSAPLRVGGRRRPAGAIRRFSLSWARTSATTAAAAGAGSVPGRRPGPGARPPGVQQPPDAARTGRQAPGSPVTRRGMLRLDLLQRGPASHQHRRRPRPARTRPPRRPHRGRPGRSLRSGAARPLAAGLDRGPPQQGRRPDRVARPPAGSRPGRGAAGGQRAARRGRGPLATGPSGRRSRPPPGLRPRVRCTRTTSYDGAVVAVGRGSDATGRGRRRCRPAGRRRRVGQGRRRRRWRRRAAPGRRGGPSIATHSSSPSTTWPSYDRPAARAEESAAPPRRCHRSSPPGCAGSPGAIGTGVASRASSSDFTRATLVHRDPRRASGRLGAAARDQRPSACSSKVWCSSRCSTGTPELAAGLRAPVDVEELGHDVRTRQHDRLAAVDGDDLGGQLVGRRAGDDGAARDGRPGGLESGDAGGEGAPASARRRPRARPRGRPRPSGCRARPSARPARATRGTPRPVRRRRRAGAAGGRSPGRRGPRAASAPGGRPGSVSCCSTSRTTS